jgi:chemotaxis protein MotB
MSQELVKIVSDLEAEVSESAPAWVVTFGDLMSLLLCFFVLLLSFSEMDRAKYKEVMGSLAKAFGVQTKTKAFQVPQGIKMIARDFEQELIPTHEKEEFVRTQERETVGKELKNEIETRFQEMKDSIQVEIGENEVTIRLMGETTFDSGKADIKPRMIPLLMKIGSVLKGTKGDITIAGHTDNVPVHGGRYQSNLKLSIARAATVAEFLLNQSAIEPRRISTMGFGKYRPLVSNDMPESRRKNRRIEIILKSSPAHQQKKSKIFRNQ